MLQGPLPWVVLSVGGAALSIGAILLGVAHVEHDGAVDEPSQAEAASLQDRAERLEIGSAVSFAIGGVIAATGMTLLAVGHF